MITANAVTQALSGLREGFHADGADLEVLGVDGTHATVRLVGTHETCWECIVPPDTLQQVVSSTVRQACQEIETVEVEDPRN